MNSIEAFGFVIHELRTQNGLSQEVLADKADLHRTYISQLERGLKAPTLPTIIKLGRVLGIPAHELIRLVEEKTK